MNNHVHYFRDGGATARLRLVDEGTHILAELCVTDATFLTHPRDVPGFTAWMDEVLEPLADKPVPVMTRVILVRQTVQETIYPSPEGQTKPDKKSNT